MTSSEIPTDPPEAVARERGPDAAPDRDRWTRRAVLAGATVAGWGFIAYTHAWHVTAASVFLSLGWVAVVAGVHNLWRTGVATSDPTDEEQAWWRPSGARDELEREKRALLKAIKEIDFDKQIGKMSDADAEALTRVYRARAIEVIKAIDLAEAGGADTARQQIEREIKARLAVQRDRAAENAKHKQQRKPAKAGQAQKADVPTADAAAAPAAPAASAPPADAAAAPAAAAPTADAAAAPDPAAAAGPHPDAGPQEAS